MEPRRKDSCSSRETASAHIDVDSGDRYVASEIRPTSVWLINDEDDQRRQPVDRLITQGSRVRSLQTHSTTSKDRCARLQYDLIHAGPALVWTKMPGAPGTLIDRTMRRKLGVLIAVCNLQLCRGRHVLAEVPHHGAAADCILNICLPRRMQYTASLGAVWAYVILSPTGQ